MLFKLSLSNIRRSLRDYAIYFFTLIIGVSIFYVFNAVGSQAAYMQMSESGQDVVELLTSMMSGISVFVAGVLGLLIVYASRFLMKRRNKEFALYLLLGMSKGKVSAILLAETVIIGLGSLVVGLAAGIGLSQLMSALVANLFEADMTAYKFTVSGEAIAKTILYFAVMYLVVMILGSLIVSRFKLIDLMQSGKRSEKIKLKNPVLCVFVFIIAAAALGYAYYQVGWEFLKLDNRKMLICIALGAVSTFLLFWSVSGMLLRVIMSMKNVYYRSLNSFTFRQISSKVNTMVFSMTVICLMLFVTICTLSSAFSIRNSMNANLNELCPADCEIELMYFPKDEDDKTQADAALLYSEYGYDISKHFKEYVRFSSCSDKDFTFADLFGDRFSEIEEEYSGLILDTSPELVALGDYNRLMELYGKEPLKMNDDEFILLCDYKYMKRLLDENLDTGKEINVFGHRLKSRYGECQNGFIDISSQHINAGFFVIPDSAAKEGFCETDYFIGNYNGETKEEKAKTEREVLKTAEKIRNAIFSDKENGYYYNINTKIAIHESTIGLGAVVTFIGLYIGLVFLIACGAILALKELSECADSVGRYEMLRRIGTEEADISRSLFCQTGIFFLLPLMLAGVHSVFGLKFSTYFLEVFGTEKLAGSIASTIAIILLIYGGYFLITYFCGKSIVRKNDR